MSSSLVLLLNFPLFHHHHHRRLFASYTTSPSLHRRRLRLLVSSADSDSESLWLREESRWLREEQRWLREERRWNSERESLLREIQRLRERIEASERMGGAEAAAAAAVMKVLESKESGGSVDAIAESGESVRPFVMETRVESVVEEKAIVVEKGKGNVVDKGEGRAAKRKKTLRFGAEGDDVRAMQEALLALGFFSGEEDMEFSSFSSGTERAVKTWQASLGAREDGIMTAELLQTLYASELIVKNSSLTNSTQISSESTPIKEDGTNGAVSSSILKVTEVQQTSLKEGPNTDIDISKHRVFLLGENRWEEPSRLISNNKQPGGTKSGDSLTKCMTCRGEGRLLCTECDGTGEANVEPQFLEWVDDGAKCPYCEGLGYTICDMCETVV